MSINDDTIPLPNQTVFEAQLSLYTCIGKGGLYRVVGHAKGAGTSREHGTIIVYEDLNDPGAAHYYRTMEDFYKRMQEVTLDGEGTEEASE